MEIRTLGRLADQLREGGTKDELERYCGMLSPSFEDFVRASKLWVRVAFHAIEQKSCILIDMI